MDKKIKKYIKTAIYLLTDILNIILTTLFLKMTMKAYDEGFLLDMQYYLRIACSILIYGFLFVFVALLIFEHTMKKTHSIWWEALSLVVLFIALMANIL